MCAPRLTLCFVLLALLVPTVPSVLLAANQREPVDCVDPLIDGGTLELQMGPHPNRQWGSAAELAPPSMSQEVE
jgi:hypothetical protein